jgi:hypothetical protein
MPRKIATLSNSEIGRIRSNLSRQNSKIGARLQACAMGTLTDKDGEHIQMSSSELKAADILFRNTLPGQVASTVEDVTPVEPTMKEMEQMYNEAIQAMPVNDLKQVLATMPAEQRQALIDSMDETSQ